MIDSYSFYKSILDTLKEHIAVIDQTGQIQYVNKQWLNFGNENNCLSKEIWENTNYIEVCKSAALQGDEFGINALAGINSVLDGDKAVFSLEYPCHSVDDKRWFMMQVTPFDYGQTKLLVIAHQNITSRKLAEEQVLALSMSDGLTNVANRRHFDTFLVQEWRRCARLKLPISLMIVDIDHFKLLNDHYGHQVGDECLCLIATTINQMANRPGDLFARYGGEEFALVLSNTSQIEAAHIGQKCLQSVRQLNFPNAQTEPKITTISAGLATLYPDVKADEADLVKAADDLLYRAKDNGRDQLVYE